MTSEKNNLRGLILDMDGVLWHSNQPIGDLSAIFRRIVALGLKFCLATNNSTRSVETYVHKLMGFGVHISPTQVITSSNAAAHTLKTRNPAGGPVFIIGEEGLVQTLSAHGFFQANQDVLAVVAGMDRDINYAKIATAARLIRSGAIFIGTNPDRTFPTPEGLMPGAGAILAALQAASETTPLIVGKPEPEMYTLALENMQVQPSETLVIGDRLETDILGAQALGCQTALLLSGVSTRVMAEKWLPQPDFIEADLGALVAKL